MAKKSATARTTKPKRTAQRSRACKPIRVGIVGLGRAGWLIKKPKGTMFVWARIPEQYREMGSVEFSKMLIHKAQVAVAPGLGFGEYGDEYVRFALIENKMRINQAVRGIRGIL